MEGVWLWRISAVFSQVMMRIPLLELLVFLSGDWRTPSELYFRMKREVQSSIRVTPMPKLNRELPPRWRSPDSQVATASSVLYLAQSGWVMTPALLMTGSTDVQPVCSRPIVKIRNRIRIIDLPKKVVCQLIQSSATSRFSLNCSLNCATFLPKNC